MRTPLRPRLRRILTGNRGSTSALLVFMMVVLIIFGLLAFLSAWSNYRLGQGSKDWYRDAYALDAQGEALSADMDAVLRRAEEQALSELTAPAPATAELAQSTNPGETFRRLYLYHAARGLLDLETQTGDALSEFSLQFSGIEAPEDFLQPQRDIPADALELIGSLTTPDGRRYLLITWRVTAPSYDFTPDGEGFSWNLRQGARFETLGWQQMQPALTPSAPGWDGTLTEE